MIERSSVELPVLDERMSWELKNTISEITEVER